MIDLIFNILNLLVFLFLLVYAFYHYLLPSLKTSFKNYKLNLIDLENQKNELLIAQLDTANKIIAQNSLCMILKDKITLWKQNTESLLFHKKNTYAQNKQKLYEKINKQSENYQYEKLKKRITPKLVASLTENLEQHFKKEENKELYFANIFKELK